MKTTERIDSVLKSRGMSRRQLAIKAGIPPSSFQSAMERGKNFSVDMLERIASALGVPISALYGETPLPDDLSPMTMGQRIKVARKRVGLTQAALAEKIGKGASTVQKYELGLIEPPLSVLERIASALGVPISALYGETPLPDDLPPIPPPPKAPKPCGVYAIRCDPTGRLYIGISTNIEVRLRGHLASLRSGKHPLELLQADFDEHGEKSLSLYVMETGLTMDEARRKEQEYMDEYDTRNPACGYNATHPSMKGELAIIHSKPPKKEETQK